MSDPEQPVPPVFTPGAAAVPGPVPPGHHPAIDPTVPMPGASAPGQPAPWTPMSGAPYGVAAEPGAPRRRAATLVLSIVAVVLLLVTGVMTALYVTQGQELDRTERRLSAQVADRDKTISANAEKIDQLEKDLQTAKDDLAAVQQTLTGTKNQADQIAKEKAAIVKCLDLLGEAGAAAARGDRSAYDKAAKAADAACAEADKYL